MKYCGVSIKYGKLRCNRYNDNRCCVGCEFEHNCDDCCESAWFYVDCNCHHSVEGINIKK